MCTAIALRINTAPTNQIINIGSGTPYKFLDIIEKTVEKINSSSNVINIEPSTFQDLVHVRHSYLNNSKLKSYRLKPQYNMDNIIDKLINFYKNK